MKTESELRAYFESWRESALVELPEPDSYRAGLAVGYLLSLATTLGDPETKSQAREAIREIQRVSE